MPIVRVVCLGWLLALFTPLSNAGTMAVRWNSVTGASGYRVYWGTSSRQYTNTATVTSTSATLTVPDATTWYVGVKAFNASGLESSTYSNEVSGMARPTVTSISPTRGAVGQRLTATITGTNFRTGMIVLFLKPGITVHSVSVTSPTTCTADISLVGPAATAIGVEVLRTDRVYGVGNALFTMDPSPNTVAPAVATVRPSPGALDVLTTVTGTVRFSEPMLRASITPSTVRILNDAGGVVAQAAGFPLLSQDGIAVSVKPTTPLQYSKVYRIQVIAGAAGVKDASGTALPATWTQNPGFTTMAQDVTSPLVASATPVRGRTGVSRLVQPTVHFSEPMLFGSILPNTVRLLTDTGGVVPQAAGYPVLSADGTMATIKLANALPAGASFRVQVVGGSTGVKDRFGNTMAVNWNQPKTWTTGQTTAATDVEGPLVTGVGTTTVGSTSVQLGWETNELSTAQVLYRPEGATEYLETEPAETLARQHRITVVGLLPETRYGFLVRSADRSGNASTSSPDHELATQHNEHRYVVLEAESGELVGGLLAKGGEGASNGGWIELPADAGVASEPVSMARYTVTVPDIGAWYLWMRVRTAGGQAGWALAVNGSAWTTVPEPSHGGWGWVSLPAGKLGPGSHVIDLGALSPGTRLDEIVLTDDPAFGTAHHAAVPVGRHDRDKRDDLRKR